MKPTLLALLCAAHMLSAACRLAPPNTPLALAASLGDTPRMVSLLDAGTDPDEREQRGLTPLQLAARGGHAEAISLLLARGASIDVADAHINGWTALMHAIHKNQPGVIALLIAAGADVNARAGNGTTALMLAAEGNVEAVRLLLAAGADPRARNHCHASALTDAVSSGSTEIVRLLLQAAPDLKLEDTMEDTVAVWLARLRGRSEIIAMLRR